MPHGLACDLTPATALAFTVIGETIALAARVAYGCAVAVLFRALVWAGIWIAYVRTW